MQTSQPLPLFIEQEYTPDQIDATQTQEINPPNTSYSNDTSSLKQDASIALLDQLFPEQKLEDKSMKQARIILAGLTKQFSNEELQEIISIFQYLTESWLDMYEREIFDGKTLQELLNLG